MSWPSLQAVSSLVAQFSPSQPGAHSQRQAPWKLVLHWPLLLHILGQPSSVQCRPFQPVTQRQVPFLHWPCCSHLNIITSVWASSRTVSLTWHHSLCSGSDCRPSPPDRHTSCPHSARGGRTPARTARCCSQLRSSLAHICRSGSGGGESREVHSPGHTAGRRGPAGHS